MSDEASVAPPLVLTAEQDHAEGWECAVVEIFGHRSHAGFIREEERFGAKMLRIDVPTNGDVERPTWETHWYGGSAVFSLKLTDAASVFKANKDLSARFSPARITYRDDEDDGNEGDEP